MLVPNIRQSVKAKEILTKWLFEKTNGKVQAGPFAGMRMAPKASWPDGNMGPKLLGCYELELHDIVEREIKRLEALPEPKIADVGCAEGYYAIGLLKRLPRARLWAFDISKKAIEVTGQNARLNRVWSRLRLGEKAEPALARIQFDWIVMDAEMAEITYLDPVRFPKLRTTPILVECHDCIMPNGGAVLTVPCNVITGVLLARFQQTHDCMVLFEGSRNPNDMPMLREMHSDFRWAAISEGRPAIMHWLSMWPKVEDATNQRQ